MFGSKTRLTRTRAHSLFQHSEQRIWNPGPIPAQLKTSSHNWLSKRLFQSGLSISARTFTLLILFFTVTSGFTCSYITDVPFFLMLASLCGAFIPLGYLNYRMRKRTSEFIEDYPTILLATASSIESGMTAYGALERSTKLLEKNHLVRQEIKELLDKLGQGKERNKAISQFGESVHLPELTLFRTGFSLVLDHGGRFAPTLSRLAQVTKDRSLLIRKAEVSTATMRMTANILLCTAPLFSIIVSLRYEGFWSIILEDPRANVIAGLGITLIIGSYCVLRAMSNFKP